MLKPHACCPCCPRCQVIEEHEEGIVVKALDSPWIPDDRHSGHWSKLKPDYVKGFELDGVIIGVW